MSTSEKCHSQQAVTRIQGMLKFVTLPINWPNFSVLSQPSGTLQTTRLPLHEPAVHLYLLRFA
jgi:hypothetical protein